VVIANSLGQLLYDNRPLVRMKVVSYANNGSRTERGSAGGGGRSDFDFFLKGDKWKQIAQESAKNAIELLSAVDAPAGEMDVVLGSGWSGVLVHEAVGHGLEGDFNRQELSAFSGRMGQMVASPVCTIIDDGALPGRRGSLNFDDEGTPTRKNVLIEKGKLVGYMQDRQNAGLMGVAPTGNGRRQDYKSTPIPRMTNTYLDAGEHAPEEIIRSVKKGLYISVFGGGQVNITSGDYVFAADAAYLIEDGKLGPLVRGATLVGNGPKSMQKITMVGNDMALDPGIGTCGKDGQGVPVNVGMPHIRINGMTVGGRNS
jgi:TldD protein